MIVCERQHLLRRCLERGYSVESVQPCIVNEDGDTITVDETHPAYPRPRPGQEQPVAKPLSVWQKATNFAKASAQHVASGAPKCSDEQIAERFAICQTCEFLKDGACEKCGCPVVREKKFISKLSWADQGCPDTPPRWGPVDGH
jgi:hypothetical protein